NGGRWTPEATRGSFPPPVPLDVATATHHTRRSIMSPSRTLCMGMEVHKDPRAVAYVAPDHGAAVTSLGPLGPRQWESDPLVRTRYAKAPPLLCVSAAGPWGSWLSRSRTNKDDDCGGVAPSLLPTNAGDRVTTDRRDAVPLARLARSGARPVGSGPTGD